MEPPKCTMVEAKRRRRNVDDIPSSLLGDIFSRLPIATILQCKRVCKAWYSYLSSPDFASAYQRQPPYISVLLCNAYAEYKLLELKADYDYINELNRPRRLRMPPQVSKIRARLVGSCNGVVCFVKSCYDSQNHAHELDLYVGNPVLGEYALLPRPNLKHKMSDIVDETYGFGFSPKTGHYKVLRFLVLKGGNPKNAEIQVLTVGVDDDWRVLGYNAPFPQHSETDRWDGNNHRICKVTLCGAIHWIAKDEEIPDFIYSFYIAEERVQPVPPPPDFGQRKRQKCLGVSHDCLCLLALDWAHLTIWRMKQYRVFESWSKETISRSILNRPYLLYPVGKWRNGETLFFMENYSLVSYNPARMESTVLRTDRYIDAYRSAIPYVPSFHHLEDILKAAGIESVHGKLTFVKEHKRIEIGSLTKHRNASTTIMDLPSYILMEIFSKLPISTISTFMGVSQTWYNFISDPGFAKAYFTNQPFVDLVISNRDSVCCFLELNAVGGYIVQPRTLQNLQMPAWISDKKTFLGSCNGLICLSMFSQTEQKCTLFICNPLLREFAVLPQPSYEKRIREEAYGFGFSSMTGHYKVLRIFTRKWLPGKSEAQVLTIGIDDLWRPVGDRTSFPMVKKWSKNGSKAHFCEVTLHRALHWMLEDSRRPDFIYSFAIDEEEVRSIPPPPGMEERNNWTSIGVLRDCLCVFNTTCPPNVDIWCMKDYRDVNSWTKESILRNYIPVGLKKCVVLPIMSWRNGEVLMYAGRGRFISYSQKEKRSTEINIELHLDEVSTALSLVPSFLPLKAATKGGHLIVEKMD